MLNLETIYKSAIKGYGEQSQMSVCQEECSELIAALSHFFRDRENSLDEVCEEIADVEIMIEQLKLIFPIDKINKFKNSKIERLKKKLESKNLLLPG